MKKTKLYIIILISLQFSIYPCSILSVKGKSSFFMAGNEDYLKLNSSIKFVPGEEGLFGYAVMGVTSYIDSHPQIAINEMGLAVDWAMVPSGEYKDNKNKPNLKVPLIPELMINCKNVNEVIDFVSGYNIDHFSYEHLMIADSVGNSAVLEWDGKKLQVIKRNSKYQLVTNFNLLSGDPFSCDRFMNGGSLLNKYSNPAEKIKDVLEAMYQEGQYSTLYSYVFNLSKKEITLFNNHDFSKSTIINLNKELEKGIRVLDIEKLEYKE